VTTEFTQLPNQLSLGDYETGRRRLVDHFSEYDVVLGIYDYGTVQHPGISDLDIILVVEGSTERDWSGAVSTSFDSLVDELVGRGNVIVMNRDVFRNLHYIDPGLEPRHLAGEDVDRRTVDATTQKHRDHASVMDWLPERVFQVERLSGSDTIAVMRALQLLKSLGYSLRTVDELIGFDPGAAFVDEVSDLRSSWFDLDPETRETELLELIESGREVGRDALSTWWDTTPSTVFADPTGRSGSGVLSYFDGLAYVEGERSVSRRDGWVTVGVPVPWFDHYRAYASDEHSLGRLISRSMVDGESDDTSLDPGYREFLDRKLEICAANFEWVRQVGLDSGAFRFGFLLGRASWSTDEWETLRARLDGLRGAAE